jgi:hypothetical protein
LEDGANRTRDTAPAVASLARLRLAIDDELIALVLELPPAMAMPSIEGGR